MNGKDLGWVERLTEDIHSTELATEHPIGISRLRRAKETFIITLQKRTRRLDGVKQGDVRLNRLFTVYQGICAAYLRVCSADFWTCLLPSYARTRFYIALRDWTTWPPHNTHWRDLGGYVHASTNMIRLRSSAHHPCCCRCHHFSLLVSAGSVSSLRRSADLIWRRSNHKTYIIGVDVPGHIAIRDQLPVDVAADLTIPPTIVDVHNADHVPLQNREKEGQRGEGGDHQHSEAVIVKQKW